MRTTNGTTGIILHNKTADVLTKTGLPTYENLDKAKGKEEKSKESYDLKNIDLLKNHKKESVR